MSASKINQSNFVILVCGDRNYDDVETITSVLNMYRQRHGSITIIQGAYSGADTISIAYAEYSKIECKSFPPKWKQHGKEAGSIRNKQMIEEGNPSLVIAFHSNFKSSKGTEDVIRRAIEHNIPVMLVSDRGNCKKLLSMDMLM
jgi:YspA, cpYpsA-related SLOG family